MAKVVNKEELINKVILNRYQITSWWTDGGLSSIYDVVDLNNQNNPSSQLVAKVSQIQDNNLKELQKSFDELAVWKNFAYANANVVTIFDYSLDGNYFYLIMEKIEGISLDKLISEKVIFSKKEVVFIVKQIVNGLKFFHTSNNQKPMVHRDIKPQNIMIDRNLKVTIIDFGISTIFGDDKPLTNEEDLFCSPQYSSPDILSLEKSIRAGIKNGNKISINSFNQIVTIQLDIHPIGLIFYILLTNQFPLSALNSKKLKDKQKIQSWLDYDIPIISKINIDIPTSIDNIIFRCTASQPEYKKYRYKSINELEKDLKSCLDKKRQNEPLIVDLNQRQIDSLVNVWTLSQEEHSKINSWFFSKQAKYFVITLVVIVLIIMSVIIGLYVTITK